MVVLGQKLSDENFLLHLQNGVNEMFLSAYNILKSNSWYSPLKNYNKFNIGDKEIEHMIGCVRDSFDQCCKMLQNQNINQKTRVMFLRSHMDFMHGIQLVQKFLNYHPYAMVFSYQCLRMVSIEWILGLQKDNTSPDLKNWHHKNQK